MCSCRSAEPLTQSLHLRILISRKQIISYLAIAQRLFLNISARYPGEQKSTGSIHRIYLEPLQTAPPVVPSVSNSIRLQNSCHLLSSGMYLKAFTISHVLLLLGQEKSKSRTLITHHCWEAEYDNAKTWNLTLINKRIRFVGKRY